MSDRKIVIFDTTLRDGEQSPGASMNIPEKLEVAQMLSSLGVDVIEAGFPVTLSPYTRSPRSSREAAFALWPAARTATLKRPGTPSRTPRIPAFTSSSLRARSTASTNSV